MIDDEERRLIAVHKRWEERAAAVGKARRAVARLSRLLAEDPGGRIAERALDLERRLRLAEVAARAMLALAESNRRDTAPPAGPG